MSSETIDATRIFLNFAHNNVAMGVYPPAVLGITLELRISPSERFEKGVVEQPKTSQQADPPGQTRSAPKFAGFQAFGPVNVKGQFLFSGPFVAVPGGTTSPDGTPVVVTCNSAIPPPGGAGPFSNCRAWYELSRGARVSYQFSTAKYPMDKWAALDKDLQEFLDRLAASQGK